MRLEVPFYKQENKYDCGPTALQMAVDYLGIKKYSRNQLQDLIDSEKSGVTWTISLAVAAAQLDFRTEFYTTCLGFNPKNYELNFYKRLADDESSTQQKLEKLKREAVRLKIGIAEMSLTLKKLLEKLDENCIPIVLLDWSKIKGTKDFIGHFVPVVGYDEDNVYIHNQGTHNTMPYMAIEKEVFEEARKSPGTDEDIVFIHRKIQ